MRVRIVGLVSLLGSGAVLAILLALVGNAATADSRWPGFLDGLRRDPWPWLTALGALSAVAVGVATWVQEHPPADRNDPPPPQQVSMPSWFVDRAETRAAVAAVCSGDRAVGITTSLWGAGGFGKTLLAQAVCAHRRVRRRFRARIYVVTIGREVRGRAAVAAKVAEVTRFITGDSAEYEDAVLAGAHLGRLLDQRPRTLLVLDDVWEKEQLTPFLQGGRRCVRLVTTRNPELLSDDAQRIQVDQMSSAQATAVLTRELPPLPEAVVEGLLRATGHWALLLRLTNRLIAEQVASGAEPTAYAERLLRRLRAHGPAVVDDSAQTWNLDDPHLRSQAVTATIEAAITLLPPGGAERFHELGIFAEDESVPVPVVALLWGAAGGLTEEQTRTLCRNLERLSLLGLDQQHGGRVTLHDVIRDYLRQGLGAVGLARAHGLLIDATAGSLPVAQPLAPGAPAPERAWWELDCDYLFDHLISHLLHAGRTALAEATAGDIRWVEARLQRGQGTPWADLSIIDTPHARSLARSVSRVTHLLRATDPARALTGVLLSRLDTHPHWHAQIGDRLQDPAVRPCLMHVWPLPDSPHNALHSTVAESSRPIGSTVIAPDGTWLAFGGDDGTVRVWDRTTQRCTAILTGHRGPVESVAIAPDGTWLASGGDDGTIRVWDRATKTCTATLTQHYGPVTSVAIAPDGTWLASGGVDGTIRVWDRSQGSCTATLTDQMGAVWSVAIAPDGTWLASASVDATVRVWDREAATCTERFTEHTTLLQGSVTISPNGTWLATTASDATVRIWDRDTGRCVSVLTGHTSLLVWSAAISPDGAWLASSGDDGTVRLWDRATGTCIATLTGHTEAVRSVAIAPDGTWLASSDAEGTVRIWDRDFTAAPPVHRADNAEAVRWVAFSPDGTWLASSGTDGYIRIWDRAGVPSSIPAALVGPLAVSPDGTWLAGGDSEGIVTLWNPATRVTIDAFPAHRGRVWSVAVSPDGTWLASAGDDGTVRLWDRATGSCTATLAAYPSLEPHQAPTVRAVAIAPDGSWLASGGDDGTVRLWDRATGSCTTTLPCEMHTVWSVAIAPDGTWLVGGDDSGAVRIWNRATGICTTTHTDHAGPVRSVAVAASGARIASASQDMTVRIWDATGQRTLALARAEAGLLSCAWGASGELASGGKRGLYLFTLLT